MRMALRSVMFWGGSGYHRPPRQFGRASFQNGIFRIGTAHSLNPRRRLQRVQHPTPSDLPPNPARVSRSGYADMAPSDSRSVNRCGLDHLACKFPINVTVPPGEGRGK